MEYMEIVLSRLSEIEAAAVKIVEDAGNSKKDIAASYEQKTKEFDAMIDAETSAKLEKTKQELQKRADTELSNMKSETEKKLKALEEGYEKNHKKLTSQILQQMIGA